MGVTYTVKSVTSSCKELYIPSFRYLFYRSKKFSDFIMMKNMKIILAIVLFGLVAQGALGTEECTFRNADGTPKTTDVDDLLGCVDGSTCSGADASAGGWNCCTDRQGRATCPPNWPDMCADPTSNPAGNDHGCYKSEGDDVDDDDTCEDRGGSRQC